MRRTPPHGLALIVGVLALPWFAVSLCVRLVVTLADIIRALVWIRRVHRDGLRCPAGHTRPIDPTDHYGCPTCGATLLGVPPYLPCPICSDGIDRTTPRFIPCECSLSVPVPPIPMFVVWLMSVRSTSAASPLDVEDDDA